MAKKEAEKFLVDHGIAEDLIEAFFKNLDAKKSYAAVDLFLDKGFSIDFVMRAMDEWDNEWFKKLPGGRLFD